MSRVSALFRLQTIDLELDAARARLVEIERALASNPAVQAARAAVAQAEAQNHITAAALRIIELDNGSLTEKIREVEGRLYGGAIRNPKELSDLQADVDSLKRRLATGEDQQLTAIESAETAEAALAAATAALRAAEAEAARSDAALTAEREALQSRTGKLEGEREAASISIPAADRQLYERLKPAKHGRPLSRMESEVCAACGIEPTTLMMQSIRRGAELVRCTGCDRILYTE
ncbi:MAG: zinc ribbon domain-containing protein [Anaerolineales bacterium]